MCLTTEQDEQLTSLYLEMYEKLVNLAYLKLHNVSLAEEAAQETFCIACRRPEAVLGSINPQGWLVTTLRYVVRNLQRMLAQRERRVLQTPGQSGDAPVYDDYADVEYADLLTDEEYRLFRRVAVDRYTMKEAAYEFGISEEACKKRVQRIRARLQIKLLQSGVPEP